MSTVKKIPASVSGVASLQRPKFSPGLLLEDDDLTLAVDYTRNLTQLMFRSLFGCGVICGYRVAVDTPCGKLKITIGKGVALNCLGEPIEMRDPQTLTLDPTCGPPLPEKLCIAIRHNDKCCAPRDVTCAPEDEKSGAVCTRIREGYEIRIAEHCPECACGCPEPEKVPEPEAPTEQPPAAPAAPPAAEPMFAAHAGQAGREPVDNSDNPCYHDHYAGECACGCCSDWVILAHIEVTVDDGEVTAVVDHSRRRFIRPVLMRDPVVYEETHPQA